MAFQLSWYHTSDQARPARHISQLRQGDSLTIGREDGASIVLKDQAVSRLHAEIFVDGNGVQVRDAGSSNGVVVDGKKISVAGWLPGQILVIGPFRFELAATSEVFVDAPRSPNSYSAPSLFTQEGAAGRISLDEVFGRATKDDKRAIMELFAGFLGRTEQVVDCGYLGSLGFVFPEHSFWCVTNSRVCGLMINRGGWMNFNFGFIKTLNRGLFVQPSLVALWIALILWLLLTLLMAGVASGAAYDTFGLSIISAIFFLLVAAAGVLMLPWVIRAFYRWYKAGCIFWTQEMVPIVIPSDRHSLRAAQHFISVFLDQKRRLE